MSSLVACGLVIAACGSDDGKKAANRSPSGGGEGGESAGKSGSAGTSGNGSAGEPVVVGGAPGGGAAGSGTAGSGVAGSGVAGSGAGGSSAGESTGGAGDVGGAGGDDSGQPFRGLYIGEEGDDAAAGTEAAPFETLAHAASVAQPGDTIVFLDGTFAMSNQAVKIPSGVNVAAKNAGQASLTSTTSIAVFELQGDSRLSGLKVTGGQRVVRFAGAAAAQGTVTIEDSSFVNCSITCVELTGATRAVVRGTEGAVLGNGGGSFAIVSNTSTLAVTSGILQNYGSGGIFRASNEATVTLTDVEVVNGTGPALTLRNASTALVTGATIATQSVLLFEQSEATELTVKSSDVSTSVSASNCFVLNAGAKLTIEGSSVHGCGTGIKGALPTVLTLVDSEFYDQSFGGTDLDVYASATVTITGCSFHDMAYTAMRMGSAQTLLNLKMRNTEIDVTSLANWHAIMLDGTSASTIDLGTLADPGGNTFIQRAATLSSAMRLQFQAVVISAVGNTWTPSAQGANAQGKYVVASGKVLEDKTAVTAGINYIKPYATTTLRLAQIP